MRPLGREVRGCRRDLSERTCLSSPASASSPTTLRSPPKRKDLPALGSPSRRKDGVFDSPRETRTSGAAAARQELCYLLRHLRGTCWRAWRSDFDTQEAGEVSQGVFASVCQTLGLSSQARRWLDAIRPSGLSCSSAPLKFHELAPEEAEELEGFATKLLRVALPGKEDPPDLPKAWQRLYATVSGSSRSFSIVTSAEFERGAGALGFTSGLRRVFRGLDSGGRGRLGRHDFEALGRLVVQLRASRPNALTTAIPSSGGGHSLPKRLARCNDASNSSRRASSVFSERPESRKGGYATARDGLRPSSPRMCFTFGDTRRRTPSPRPQPPTLRTSVGPVAAETRLTSAALSQPYFRRRSLQASDRGAGILSEFGGASSSRSDSQQRSRSASPQSPVLPLEAGDSPSSIRGRNSPCGRRPGQNSPHFGFYIEADAADQAAGGCRRGAASPFVFDAGLGVLPATNLAGPRSFGDSSPGRGGYVEIHKDNSKTVSPSDANYDPLDFAVALPSCSTSVPGDSEDLFTPPSSSNLTAGNRGTLPRSLSARGFSARTKQWF